MPGGEDWGGGAALVTFPTKTNAEKARRLAENFSRLVGLARLYEAYQARLRRDSRADFDDQILALADALESDADLPWELRERFLYVLVDEFQDTSGAQLRILAGLAGDDPDANIFAVGDDDQAIFRFQGASAENFSWFRRRFPGSSEVHLTENYRSGQKLLDAARALMRQGFGISSLGTSDESLVPSPAAKQLRAQVPGEHPEVWEYPDAESELRGVAREIRARLDAGEDPAEIAVLFRKNKTAPEVAAALARENVPYLLADDLDALAVREVRTVIAWLRWLAEPGRTDLLAVLALGPDSPLGEVDRLRVALKRDSGGIRDFLTRRKKLILLHGKDTDPTQKWYPWLIREATTRGFDVHAPALPRPAEPRIAEWTAEIRAAEPDEETVLVGHSRGGMAILRFLESAPSELRVRKVILVATNRGARPDGTGGDFFTGDYDFARIRSHCDDFVVFHSQDDEWVDFSAGEHLAAGLGARIWAPTDRGHFGSRLPKPEIPELLAELPADALDAFRALGAKLHAQTALLPPSELAQLVIRETGMLGRLLGKDIIPPPRRGVALLRPGLGGGSSAELSGSAENGTSPEDPLPNPPPKGEDGAAATPLPALRADSGARGEWESDGEKDLLGAEALGAVVRFLRRRETADPSFELADFFAELEALRADGKILAFSPPRATGSSVTLATAHRSKGLEWRRVWIVRGIDGTWGGNRSPADLVKLPASVTSHDAGSEGGTREAGFPPSDADASASAASPLQEESRASGRTPASRGVDRASGADDPDGDERRLFFVALTRAREECVVSWARRDDPASPRENLPSRFLAEIGDAHFLRREKEGTLAGEILDNGTSVSQLTSKPGEITGSPDYRMAGLPQKPFFSARELAVLRERLGGFRLSPSALGTLRDCGLRFALAYLLRIPTPAGPGQAFGTAVHFALERHFAGATGDVASWVREALDRERLAPGLREKLQAEAEEMLRRFIAQRPRDGRILSVERSLEAAWEGIPLKGKVDLLETSESVNQSSGKPGDDTTGSLVHRITDVPSLTIVDWKTASPRSRNAVLGRTADGDRTMLEQLLFYRLLLESSGSPLRGKPTAGRIDFVSEPGAAVTVGFDEVAAEDEEFRAGLCAAWEEIRTGDFIPTTDPEVCGRCDYRDSCPRARR